MKLLARGPVRLLLLGTAVTTMLVGASAPLNPLVVRTPSARGTVPVDCDQSLSPTPPQRVEQRDIRDIPLPQAEPAEAVAPPSTSLRTALQATQNALVRNDRPEFNRSLETARSILLHYPTGAERRTGEELLRIYDAAARLWDAQFQSPFFDETAPEYALVSGYPGYAEAVRRSTITDASGRRFYPAAESREFLARIAADRLRGIGIATPPPRVARSNRPATEPATPDVTPTTRPRKTTQTRETIARNTPAPAPSTTTTATTTKRSTRATTRHPASTPARAHASSAS
ncbi:MAG: hypothetical protein M3Q69_09940, partial [Acidobacteriota bacterium]|nr:hypothetical protein [Acidobacteriota bacterium]